MDAKRLGKLPPGLEVTAGYVNDVVVTANNRTLFVAQEAGLSNIPVKGLNTGEGVSAVEKQFRLAMKKGGSGFPIDPYEIDIRQNPCP